LEIGKSKEIAGNKYKKKTGTTTTTTTTIVSVSVRILMSTLAFNSAKRNAVKWQRP